ncbi:MAG: hypothetical protein V1676_00235 [Candidatus Diapherotrites archaeon]
MIWMKYRILVRRLLLWEGRYISDAELKVLCARLKIPYKSAIMYLFTNKYLKRIVRGFFYIPSAEERRLKTGGPNVLEAIAKAMDYKKVRDWYFGLETAIKLNAITHEYFTIDYVVSDTIFRAKPMEILGRRVKFVKLKKGLFGFGTKRNGPIIYSGLEKTLLDLIHLKKHGGKKDGAIRDDLIEWAETASRKKLKEYSKHYGMSVRKAAEALE